ncbi:MAG TPA: hypothetical protein VMM37_00245 [Bacteroidota bacterium]|nr:hypothetical protein [Bacteroidota bacterium]
MRILSLMAAFALVLVAGCWREVECPTGINPPTTDQVRAVAEGFVICFNGGGTVEISYPPGLRLAKRRWLTLCSDTTLPIYLTGVVDSSSIGRWVRAYGCATKTKLCGSVPTYVYYILELKADSIRFVEAASS